MPLHDYHWTLGHLWGGRNGEHRTPNFKTEKQKDHWPISVELCPRLKEALPISVVGDECSCSSNCHYVHPLEIGLMFRQEGLQ